MKLLKLPISIYDRLTGKNDQKVTGANGAIDIIGGKYEATPVTRTDGTIGFLLTDNKGRLVTIVADASGNPNDATHPQFVQDTAVGLTNLAAKLEGLADGVPVIQQQLTSQDKPLLGGYPTVGNLVTHQWSAAGVDSYTVDELDFAVANGVIALITGDGVERITFEGRAIPGQTTKYPLTIPGSTALHSFIPRNGTYEYLIPGLYGYSRIKRSNVGVSAIVSIKCVFPDSMIAAAIRKCARALTNRSGTITAGGASQLLAADNPLREELFFLNISSETLWINNGGAAALASPSIPVLPNGWIRPNTTEAIYVIGATTGSAFIAREG